MNKIIISLIIVITLFISPYVYANTFFLNYKDSDILRENVIEDIDKNYKEKRILTLQKNPYTSATLSLLLPGLGHIYYGDNLRGISIIGGAIGVFLISYVTVLPFVGTENKVGDFIARVMSVAPFAAYWTWSATDAFYQTELFNKNLELNFKNF